MLKEYQYTNQFFEEGKMHFECGGSIADCPYNYLAVEQDNDQTVQAELYRQREWLEGFRFGFSFLLEQKKTA